MKNSALGDGVFFIVWVNALKRVNISAFEPTTDELPEIEWIPR